MRDIGRLFDQARDSAEGWEPYAKQLGESFADNRGLLEDVLSALFAIARADKPLTVGEQTMLREVHRLFGLDNLAWDMASGGTSRRGADGGEDAYAVLGRRPHRHGRGAPPHLAAPHPREPPGHAGLARRAGRFHRPRQREGRADQRGLGPDQARAGALKQAPRTLPNWDERPPGTPIDTLILHYTGMQSAEAAIERLRDPVAHVSSHYVVEEDGTVWRLVDEAHRAFHAGISHWRGHEALNGRSVGIEIVNPGHEWGYRPFPALQMAAVCDLCLEILGRHPIPARNVVGHSDVAPDRKQDPGELFDWPGLAANGVGLWPPLGAEPLAEEAVPDALRRIGYPIPDLRTTLVAFQRHWRPSCVDGLADAETRARLARPAARS